MQQSPVRFIAAFVLGSMPLFAMAAGVGFVDMERVFQSSPQGRAAQERISGQFASEQREFAGREQEIRQLQARLQRDAPLMSKAQLDKKQGEIQALVDQLEKDFAGVQEQVAEIQQQEAEKLMEPAQKAIAAAAKQEGLSAVFEVRTFDPNRAGMLYFEEGSEVDLTEAVVEQLNQQ